MTKCFCDRCKEEIKAEDCFYVTITRRFSDNRFELCELCAKAVKSSIEKCGEPISAADYGGWGGPLG